MLLARRGLSGSAFALVRPVFEILYRATWMFACAQPKDVDRIKDGKFKFPQMGALVASIDAKHGFDFFKNFKASSWGDQNDFTHGGKLQIGSRLTRDDLQASYPDDMIAGQVGTATIAALLVTVLLLKTHNRIADGEHLELTMADLYSQWAKPVKPPSGCGSASSTSSCRTSRPVSGTLSGSPITHQQ